MTAFERYAIEAGVSLALVWGIVTFLEHRGAEKYEAADKALAQQQETHNIAAEATQHAKDTQAENVLEQTPKVDPGSLPALPASLHASCPSPVPQTRTATVAGDYLPDVRASDTASLVPPSWADFERSDVQRARDADAEVIYLQSLLDAQYRVCGGS